MSGLKVSRVRLTGRDKVLLFSDLSTMLIAGIPILEAIEALLTDSKGRTRIVLQEFKRSLVDGKPLSGAMEHFPRSFDPVLLNTLRAAEAGGTLEETMKDLVSTLKKEVAFTESIRQAMIYPAFIGAVFTGIILLMLTFVIPRISQVFSSMRVNMPPLTQLMINVSNIFIEHWIIISAGFVVFIMLVGWLVSANRRTVVRLVLSLPGLRTLGSNIDLARMSRSFALLLHSGVALDEALRLTKRVVQRQQIEAVIAHMQQNIETGKALGEGLRDFHHVLPPIMARSIETAETSGTLEQTMQNLAEYFDDQVTNSLKTVSNLIEPVMIVVIGFMVGGLMITVIAPIYNLISQVSPK